MLFEEVRGVLAKAKALTTRADLALGIGAVLDAVIREGCVASGDIGMVALSTTLATNSLVEGLGTRVCLVGIGFEPADLDRAGLREAVKNDAVAVLAGGHDPFGNELAPLDLNPCGSGSRKTSMRWAPLRSHRTFPSPTPTMRTGRERSSRRRPASR